MKSTLASLIVFSLFALTLYSQTPQVLDPTWDQDGLAAPGYCNPNQSLIATYQNSNLYIGANQTDPLNANTAALLRYLPDGTLDPTFGTQGTRILPNTQLIDITVDPNGAIYLLTSENPQFLKKLNTDGSDDPSFNLQAPPSWQLIDKAFALTQAGHILVCGRHGNPTTAIDLAQFLPTGALDPYFGQNGTTQQTMGADNYIPKDIKVLANQTIALHSHIEFNDPFCGTAYFDWRAVLSPDGLQRLGQSQSETTVASPAVHSITPLPDGGFLMYNDRRIQKFDSLSAPDLNFGNTSTILPDPSIKKIWGIWPAQNAQIFAAAATMDYPNRLTHPKLLKYNADGTQDLNFGTQGQVELASTYLRGEFQHGFIQGDGKFLTAGTYLPDTVTNSNYACAFTARFTDFQAVAIHEPTSNPIAKFSIFPNPSQGDQIYLLAQTQKATTITVNCHNAAGRQVLPNTTYPLQGESQKTITMPLPNLPAGIYFLHIQSPSTQQTLKFTIQ